MMKLLIVSFLFAPVALLAQEKHSAADTSKDVQRHRAMAAAHESAARCLEKGGTHDACMRELQASCKGLAIGKYCGMRHEH